MDSGHKKITQIFADIPPDLKKARNLTNVKNYI